MNRAVAAPAVLEALEAAGAAAATELVHEGRVIDLRDALPEEVRAGGAAAPVVSAVGCPCGCGETELILRAREGDATALAVLLDRYRWLARSKSRSYFVLGADREDVVQEAMIGLYTAVRDFVPERGVSFRTFAEVCVSRSVLTAVKRGARHKHGPLNRALRLEAPASTLAHDHDGPTLAELVPAVAAADPLAEVIAGEQLTALMCHLAEVLSDLEVQVLRHHVQGKSYDDIAGMLQRHVKSVDNALQRIRRKVQEHLDARLQAEAG